MFFAILSVEPVMLRNLFSFFSMLSFGVLGAAAVVAIVPWLSGQSASGVRNIAGSLQFESVMLGVVLGILVGWLGRFDWAEVPRRIVSWFLIRERQLFYWFLLAMCFAILLFY